MPAKILPINPTLDPTPAAPAGHILHFAPRTEVLGVRMPPELAAWVQREADKRFWSKSHLALRIITAFAEAQGSELGFLRAQGKREVV